MYSFNKNVDRKYSWNSYVESNRFHKRQHYVLRTIIERGNVSPREVNDVQCESNTMGKGSGN